MNYTFITLILLITVVLLLIIGKTPLSVIGLGITAVLVAIDIDNAHLVLNQYSSRNMFLICEVFIISGAMMENGIADRIGNFVKKIVGDDNRNNHIKVIVLISLFTTLMCAFLPRLAVAATLIPVVISISKSTRISRTKLLFVMAMMCSVGGSITLISTPPNLIAKSILEESNLGSIGFFDFAFVGIPMAIIGVIAMVLVSKFNLIPDRINENDSKLKSEKLDKISYDKTKQILSTGAFLILVLSLIVERYTQFPSYVVGLIGVIVLISTKTISEKSAFQKHMNWSMLFFVSGMLALGDAISRYGLGEIMAKKVVNLLGSNPSPFLILSVFFILSAFLIQIMNNTAAAGMLIPIGLTISTGLGLDPKSVVMAVVIGCNSSFMTPMATPANAMVMEPGKIKFVDFFKVGLPIMIIVYMLVIFIFPSVYPF